MSIKKSPIDKSTGLFYFELIYLNYHYLDNQVYRHHLYQGTG